MAPRFAISAFAVALLASILLSILVPAALAAPNASIFAVELPIEAPLPGATLDSHGAASPPELFTVDLERAPTKTALIVEPHADGMVALYEPGGSVAYVPRYRIQRIQGSNGEDRTDDVLLRGRRLGPARTPRIRAPVPWRRFRLRAGPEAECASYLITDSSLLWRTGGSGYASNEEQVYASIDYGYAANIGPRQSIGGAIFFGADGARSQVGLRLHTRRWLTPEMSFDLAPGVILAADEEGNSRFLDPGFAGQAGLTLQGRFGITGQMFSIRRDSWRGEERETAFHLGFHLGAEPGIVATWAYLLYGMVELQNNSRQFTPSF